MKNNWLKIALLNFLVVALLGLFLRWFMVSPPAGFNYKYLLHAHSHAAILGWLFTAFFVALTGAYLPEAIQRKKSYQWQFWLGQLSVLGMLLSFPLQGYGLYAIAFTTLHMLVSYWFIGQFLADARQHGLAGSDHKTSFRFIKAALFFLALSTLGPWSLGPVMAAGGSGSPLYFNAIYFYLHFQYNGWLSFAALGLLFWMLEHHRLAFSRPQALLVFHLFFWACLPAFLLSVLWIKPPALVYWLAGLGALVQTAGLVLLLRLLCQQRQAIAKLFSGAGRYLFCGAVAALVLKTGLQQASAIPFVADLAYAIRNFIIGYLHLVLIGFISLFLFAFFMQRGQLNASRRCSRWGLGLFIMGFVLSEGLLFVQGLFFWLGWGLVAEYFRLLFWVSTLMPAGLLLFICGQWEKRSAQRNQPEKQLATYRVIYRK